MGPNPNSFHHHHHHHHHQGMGVDPISPTLGGCGAVPPSPPRLQHSPPSDANTQQYYTGMGSIGSTISGWSQCWQQDTTAMLSSGSATDYNFPPILQEFDEQQRQCQYHHEQPQQCDLISHPPQLQMRMPPSLSSTTTVDPSWHQGGEKCQITPVSTHSSHQQLNSQSAEGHTTCSTSPSCGVRVPVFDSPPAAYTADNQSVPDPEESSKSSLCSESSAASVNEVLSLTSLLLLSLFLFVSLIFFFLYFFL